MGFHAHDLHRDLTTLGRAGERTAADVRDQRDRAEFYRRVYYDALNNIQEILNRPESIGDYVQDMEDIQREIIHARKARWS